MEDGVLRIAAFRGLDQSADEALIDRGASPDAFDMDCRGGVLRQGRAPAPYIQQSVPGGVETLMCYYPRNRPAQILAASDSALYAWRAGEWAQLLGGLSAGRFSSVNYQIEDKDVLLLAGGADGAYCYDGESVAPLPGDAAHLAHLCLHVERAWGAGAPGEPDTVRWARPYRALDWESDPVNPETGGGFLLVPTWNGGRVRALRTLFDDVVVFKDEDIFRIFGTYPGNYEVVRVHGVVGPLAERSIVAAGDQCYFLSGEGLCVYDGVRAVQAGGGRARTFLQGLSRPWAHMACAAAHEGCVYLSVPTDGSSVNNALLALNQTDGYFMIHRGVCAQSFLSFDGRLLFGGPDGVVYALAAGGGARASYVTPWMDAGAPCEDKWVQSVTLQGTGELLLCVESDARKKLLPVRFGPSERALTLPVRQRCRRFRLRVDGAPGGDFLLRGGLSVQLGG